MKPTPETVSATQVPEVRAFTKHARELAKMKADHSTIFERLRRLAVAYNAALEGAAAALKIKRVGCGPFDLYEFRPTRDLAKFAAAVGDAEFVRLGGVIGTAATYSFDPKRFDALVVEGKITPEVEAKCVVYTPYFHKPDPLLVP